MNHVMVDLETLSNTSNALIVAIGAVRFDGRQVSNDKFYTIINAKSAQRVGGHIDAGTVMWWLQQSEKARTAILSQDALPIEAGLKAFAEWIRKSPLQGIWGNGSDFDNVILRSAYESINWVAPWAYGQNRCYRTIKNLNHGIPFVHGGTAHDALEDAVAQAKHLCEILTKLGISI